MFAANKIVGELMLFLIIGWETYIKNMKLIIDVKVSLY